MSNRISVGVLPIQTAVATASPHAWRDGLVHESDEWSVSVTLVDGGSMTLATGARLPVGEPVAVHPVAEVLADGRTWYSARVVDASR